MGATFDPILGKLRSADAASAGGTAAATTADTAAFNGVLSAADDTVQKALDTLDNVTPTSLGAAASYNGIEGVLGLTYDPVARKFGLTATGTDWTLELSLDASKTDTWTLPQTNDPVVQVRATRTADGAMYESNPSGSLTVDMQMDPATNTPKLRWTVAATLGHTSGGTMDPAAVSVAGDIFCPMG